MEPSSGNAWVHLHTVWLFHQTEISHEALSSGARIPPHPPPPPPQNNVIFIVRPSGDFTAGRNVPTFYVLIAAKR